MNFVVYDAKNEELSSIDLHCTRWESKAGMYVNAVPFWCRSHRENRILGQFVTMLGGLG
jgi:hypothetical protein